MYLGWKLAPFPIGFDPLLMLIREVIHFEHDAFKAILRPFFSLVSKMSHHTSLLFLNFILASDPVGGQGGKC